MRTEGRLVAAAACFATLGACGTSGDTSSGSPDGGSGAVPSAGGTTIAGTISGRDLAPVDTYARKGTLVTGGSTSIYVVSRSGTCDALVTAPRRFAGTTYLELALPRVWPPPTGVYPIVPVIATFPDGGTTMGAFANLYRTDATCMFVGSDDDGRPLDGSVTVESTTDQQVSGRVDLRFRGGELHGTFAAILCDLPFPRGDGDKTCRP